MNGATGKADEINKLHEAVANLELLDYEPDDQGDLADRKKQEWAEKCLKQSRLLTQWHNHKVNQDLLKKSNGPPRQPRAFNISCDIYKAVFENKLSEIDGIVDLKICPDDRFAKSLILLLKAEEAFHSIEMRKLDLTDELLKVDFEEESRWVYSSYCYKLVKYVFSIANLSERSPALVVPDYIIISVPSIDGPSLAFAVQIDSIQGDSVGFANNRCNIHVNKLAQPVNIAFVSSGSPFFYNQRAAEELQRNLTMQRIVLEKSGQPQDRVNIDMLATNTPELEVRMDELNASQRRSVIGILEAKCWPKPYILFGPPGTGKTRTLIEAIVQLYRRSRLPQLPVSHEELEYNGNDMSDYGLEDLDELTTLDDVVANASLQGTFKDIRRAKKLSRRVTCYARILVCVNSNTCTDDLFAMLKKELPDARISRLGKNQKNNQLSPDVIVTTNTKAGCLAGRDDFDYVFVDEAGHANVPESLIPITLLKSSGVLVLAGDPKQLGPVVMYKQAADLGLSTSLLERLFAFAIYQRDSKSGSYNNDYITMLNDCYRCDERIMVACNKLFYHGDLKFTNKTPISLLKMMTLTSPLQFLGVAGCEDQTEGSTSWHNLVEADLCVEIILQLYRMGVEPAQIGVTTPYKAQYKEIQARLKSALELARFDLCRRFPGQVQKLNFRNWQERSLKIMKAHNLITPYQQYYEIQDGRLVEFDFDSYTSGPRDLYETDSLAIANWSCKIHSIDSFQGNEREIMIISTVRTDTNPSRLDFLNDSRRFNVAVSRAKWLALVVGSKPVLELGEYWPQLISSSKSELGTWLDRARSPELLERATALIGRARESD